MSSILEPPTDNKPDAPARLQRKRTKGWRMPEGAVYVGRPTKFGNPFRVVKSPCCPTWDVTDDNGVMYLIDHQFVHAHDLSLETPQERRYAARMAVSLFGDELLHWFGGRIEIEPGLREAIAGLAGHDLVCWCALDQPCHADVLLKLANR